MKTRHKRALLGGLALIAIGLSALPSRADIIAADGFNYIPLGVSLDGANGGSVLPPGSDGWATPWSADATATVGAGLTYSGYTPSLGIGNSVTLGAVVDKSLHDPVAISRQLNDSSTAGNTVWMRMLYNQGAHVEESVNTATPFQLFANNNGNNYLDIERTVGAGGGVGDMAFTLNMSGVNADHATFDMGLGTHMLLFKLDIDQLTDQNETLSMWLDPTTTTEPLEPTATASISANILEGGDDFLALFSAAGYGDRIDELVIGTTFGGAISQLNDPVTAVPEVSAPVMMLIVSLPAIGVIWLRRRKPARA